jgi:hypothetical protein
VGSQTSVNLWNTTSTTVNAFGVATGVNVGVNAAALSTLTFGPAITGNIFKIGSTAGGSVVVTSDVTTGNVYLFNNVAGGGTVWIAGGGATTTNIGGASANLFVGTTGGDSKITIYGNATGGTAILTTNAATGNLFNTNATTVNIAGAGTSVNIGATTGTTTVANPALTMNNSSTTFNMNGTAPSIAGTSTGTASIFNANLTVINFGQAADISMGGTNKTVTVRGALAVNGNTTLGDASSDTVTYNANTSYVPNTYTFTLDDASTNGIGYPIKFSHTTTGTAAVGIGTGVQFITENAAGTAVTGASVESLSTNVTNGAESFNLVLKTMTAGAAPVQVVAANTSTLTVGASSTATTINTQTGSNLTLTPGAVGATSSGSTLTVSGGIGGATSGAGGAATFKGGDAQTSAAGGVATFKSGAAVGTNITGSNTIIQAGNGTGNGGSGNIVFQTASAGSSGATANSMVDRFIIDNTGVITFSSNVTVGGNLTVNGTVTTLNSSTVTIDDKNIELASVAVITGLTVTATNGSAVLAFIGSSTTTGLLAGQTLTITSTQSGAPVINGTISSVDSLTQVTMSAVTTGTTGNVTVSSSGATDASADGGGITVLGTSNKTWNYVNANTAWTSNQNVDIASSKTYKISTTDVLSSSAVLQNATTASIGSTAAATTVNIGANTQNNILQIYANGTGGTATLQTNVTTGTVNEYSNVTTGTINVGSANAGRLNVLFNQTSSSISTGALVVTGGVGVSGAFYGTTGNFNSTLSVGGKIQRTASGVGYLDGNYSTVETTNTSGAIYSIGGSYVPGTTSLGTMYGIGYGYSGGTAIGQPGSVPVNIWGLYGASNGTARWFLDSDNGRGYFAGNLYVNGGTQVVYNSGTWSINISGTAASETLSTVAGRGNSFINSASSGISIGETFTNYDSWNTQLNVHGGPHARVHVKTNTVRMGMYAHDSWQAVSGTTPGGFVGTYNNYPVSILVNTTQRMVFDTNGSVGINTTSPSLGSGGAGLNIVNSTYTQLRVQSSSTSAGLEFKPSTGNSWEFQGTNSNTFILYDRGQSQYRWSVASTGNMSIGWNNDTDQGYKLAVNGSFAATTKSFLIDHPTKPGMKLRYGSLEGPENGVYVRGKLTDSRIIELPDYWTGLVDMDTITVNLTPIGKFQKLYVEKIEGGKIYIDNDAILGGNVNCFYIVFAERKDVEKLQVEIDKE